MPGPEERPAPKPPPAAEKPRPAVVERVPLVRTPVEGKKGEDAPLDAALPELDAILKDLDDLLPPPDGKRGGGPGKGAKATCPACGAVLERAKGACVRCGRRLPASP
jgi:hypothetical protein